MSKKLLLTSIGILLLMAAHFGTFAQQGAIIFDYDASGQRILRHYDPYIMLAKNGDTMHVESSPDTIKRITDAVIVKAYPNPAIEELIVENISKEADAIAIIEIFDIAGKFIGSYPANNPLTRISLAHVVPGAYQVNYFINKELLNTWKIIKQ